MHFGLSEPTIVAELNSRCCKKRSTKMFFTSVLDWYVQEFCLYKSVDNKKINLNHNDKSSRWFFVRRLKFGYTFLKL